MSEEISRYDAWLTSGDGPAALVIREQLTPVEGPDGILFPPTFAAGDGFPGGYNVDRHDDGKSVCLVDSVGSQANRIEPIFADEPYASLIPQVTVKAGDKIVNLLEAGHRAGDALMRCSKLGDELREAFKALLKGDAEPLARIAPTSLVFGVWDSRDTQAKLPRLVSSVIRAYDVRVLTRGAVYMPPVDYSDLEVFSEADKAKAEGDKKNPLAKRGFVHNPASASHGGIIADGGIRRDATLSVAALQQLQAADEEKTLKLRRYILGLSLVAFTAGTSSYLRQGCNLVLDPEQSREFHAVYRDGRREDVDLTHEAATSYASAAAKGFEIGEKIEVDFDKSRAKADVKKKDS
jgi:CRISPR-associated protein Csb1